MLVDSIAPALESSRAKAKGQAEAERDARDRKLRARNAIRIAVEEALDAG